MRIGTPLGLFSVLWAAAACLHHLEATPLEGLPIYPFAVLIFLGPERIGRLVAFCVVHGLMVLCDLPTPANHMFLGLLVDTCVLIACGRAWRRDDGSDRERHIWETVRGPLRATLAVLYVFAVFHKLNTSFLNPEVSCAITQLSNMMRLNGFELPWERSVLTFSIHLTLVAELAIIALMLRPRLAHVGALIGLVFHTALGWANFFDFATVVFSVYLFFFPWDRIQASLSRVPRWAPTSFVVCLALLAAISFYIFGYRKSGIIILETPTANLTVTTFICALWTAMVWPILLPIFRHSAGELESFPSGRVALLWLVPAVALLNGATPYLGLKTVANFAMFSNLRTEGGETNHLLVPAGRLFLADYQTDLATIEAIKVKGPAREPWWVRLTGGRDLTVPPSPRWLREGQTIRVPFLEVRRTVQRWRAARFRAASIVYERGGVVHERKDAFSDPELMRPLSLWERRLLAFHAVDDDGEPSMCRY